MLASAALLAAAAALLAPRWTLLLLLAALPFAVHHPSTAPTVLLVVLTAAFEVGYLVRTRPSWAGARHAVATQPILLLAALFAAAACLSLATMPLASIWREYQAILGPSPSLRRITSVGLDWLLLSEGRREFPVTAALLTVQGFGLALIVACESAGGRMAVRMAAAVATGLLVALALGLLEAFAGVSLAPLRGDAAGSVAIRPGTLQSVAGNPGWFSQFVVYALPYALVLFAGTSRRRLRLIGLTVVVGVSAFALLVSFQRGGWIVGLLVIGYVAAATRGLRAESQPRRLTRRAVWGAALAVVVLAALVAAGMAAWTRVAVPADGANYSAAGYLARLQSIGAGDRLPYLSAGARIAALHPVLGGGHESFAYRYRMYFERPGGPYRDSGVRVPDPASAHSVYLQTWTGTGTVGLLVLLGLFAVSWTTAWRVLRHDAVDRARRVALLAAAGSLLGMACYGLVQEIFYVHALRLLFFVAIGLVAGAGRDAVRWPSGVAGAAAAALVLAFAGHLAWEFAWPGPGRLLLPDQPSGLYAEQPGAEGFPVRWSAESAAWPIPAGATRYAFRVKSMAPWPQEVGVRACGGALVTRRLTDHQWHTIEGSLAGCGAADRLRLSVAPTWTPPTDVHTLGVLTAEMRLE